MTDYTKTTDFTSKDSLPSGDSGKIIRGAEFGTEFDNIQTAVNSKSNIENPSFTGNITVTGTVDGRDIAADGTKLDTIETSADVTDTANVTAAGAVMDSELTNIAAVKALNQGVATTDSPTFAAVTSTGNVTVGGTVDGRDVAADGTKLDGIEAGATADQTAAQIKTAYESNADTNAFTDADHTKLDGIEASADVTDTTNVTAAGALMDSEVTNLAQVKAFDSSDYATAAQGTTADNALPKTGGAMTGAITTNSTFDGRDVATDGTKLDGIEASADVTDTANVTAAGAVMDSELTSEASVKALNQGVATTDSPTFAGATVNGTVEFDGLSGTGAVTVTDILDQDDMSGNSATALATQQSIKSYVDSQVATSDTLAEVLANGNATGGTDVAFGDNDKAIFGAGSDLQIYHDGSNSYIENTAPFMLIESGTVVLRNTAGTEDYAKFNENSDVKLYFDNSQKFATTSTGIDVTGTVTADGLDVSTATGSASPTATELKISSSTSASDWSTTDNWGVLGFYSADASGGGAGNRAEITVNMETATGAFGSLDFTLANPGSAYAQSSWLKLENSASSANRKVSIYADSGLDVKGGDVAFYEDTGTTAKFFWDASAERLGIGTTSPASALDIIGLNQDAIKIRSNVAPENYYQIGRNQSTGLLEFKGSEATYNGYLFKGPSSDLMTITASGNVGIGTSSIDLTSSGRTVVQVEGSSNALLNLTDGTSRLYLHQKGGTSGADIWNSANSYMRFATNDTERMRIDSAGLIQIGNAGSSSSPTIQSLIDPNTGIFFGGADILGFSTGGSERARFDSSGNLLVSKSSLDVATVGLELRADGLLAATRSGTNVAVFRRLSDDGSIVDFQRDSATVGSITADAGSVGIGSGNCGLLFYDAGDRIIPRNGTSTSDGTLDLGATTDRFKDLYLSGGAYLGGTASANHLDDYEEGTFTPVITGTTGTPTVAYYTQSGLYTKIGRTVYYRIGLRVNTISGGGGVLRVTGLPFTAKGYSAYTNPFAVINNGGLTTSQEGPFILYVESGATNLQARYANTNADTVFPLGLVQAGTYFLAEGFYEVS